MAKQNKPSIAEVDIRNLALDIIDKVKLLIPIDTLKEQECYLVIKQILQDSLSKYI